MVDFFPLNAETCGTNKKQSNMNKQASNSTTGSTTWRARRMSDPIRESIKFSNYQKWSSQKKLFTELQESKELAE